MLESQPIRIDLDVFSSIKPFLSVFRTRTLMKPKTVPQRALIIDSYTGSNMLHSQKSLGWFYIVSIFAFINNDWSLAKWPWPILKVNLYPAGLSSLQGLFTLNLKEAFKSLHCYHFRVFIWMFGSAPEKLLWRCCSLSDRDQLVLCMGKVDTTISGSSSYFCQ